MQGMDDQALEVLKAAKATEEVLAGKAESLAAVRTEYERKQKEVPPQPPPRLCSLCSLQHTQPAPLDKYGMLGAWSVSAALQPVSNTRLVLKRSNEEVCPSNRSLLNVPQLDKTAGIP